MKILVFASPDGNLDLINQVIAKHPETMFCINLGDMCLHSESTKLEYFLRSKFRHEAQQSIEWNKENKKFDKIVINLLGCNDDPFIPANELNIYNLSNVWSKVEEFIAHDSHFVLSEKLTCGFLSGYFNSKKFPIKNKYRVKMSRERKSLALCQEDFEPFKNLNQLDMMFCYEQPLDAKTGLGCKYINEKIIDKYQPKFIFSGHYRKWKFEDPIISVGSIKDGYLIVDLYGKTYQYYNN